MKRKPNGDRAHTHSRDITLTCIAIACGLLLFGEVATAGARWGNFPIRVTVDSVLIADGKVSVSITLRSTEGVLGGHVALLSGTTLTIPSHVFVFYDPAFPSSYTSTSDILWLKSELAQNLAIYSPGVRVSFVNADQLPETLLTNPKAALIDFGYGIIPSDVFGPNTSLLRSWIEGGGTFIWAGGPLAYFIGMNLPNGGFQEVDLGWAGQVALVGYNLEDPVGNPSVHSYGALVANNESELCAALGLEYKGTADGANVSQVNAHGGRVLGYLSHGVGPSSDRTSLAWLPLGSGSLYFFGGATWANGLGMVPNADVTLSADLAFILSIGFIPDPEATSFIDVNIPPYGSTSVTLVDFTPGPDQLVLVSSTVAGTYLSLWFDRIADYGTVHL